jgi:UDP-N-acetylmuramoyl-tripeptide--D-alanyl-D-alanine ligase
MERRMMDTATAARAVGGRLLGNGVTFARVATDTRTIEVGDLFVALKGERFDGHDFVGAAFERGAAAALVADDRASAISGERIAVTDPLAALGRLARHWRGHFAIPVVVIVGSNGKTTVKEMVAAILRAHWGEAAVHATRGNLNNAIGLPLTVLGLRAVHKAAAIELGMNHPGETAELAPIAAPTIAIVNNAQREHQEFMRSTADVAQEHAAAIHALPSGGAAVLNANDPHARLWREAANARAAIIMDFALEGPAAVRGHHEATPEGGMLDLATPGGEARVRLAAAGRHNAANALAAAAAALAAGVPLAAVARGLEAFRPVAGRLVTRTVRSGAVVVDDSYNANPDSVRAAIAVLAAMPGARWLALGDMGEVGTQGPAFHREIGEFAKAQGIGRLFAAGPLSGEAVAAFGEGALHFASVEALAAHLAGLAAAGTTVLVKGSRFMRMERVVAALAGEAADGGPH